MEDIEGAAMADLDLEKTRRVSRGHAAGRRYLDTGRVVRIDSFCVDQGV